MDKFCGRCFQETLNDRGVCLVCGFDEAANREAFPMALPAGSILYGRYIVGRVLGQGGFGITYTARDHQTGETVAIKEFFPDSMATRTGRTTVMPLSGEKGENFTYGRNTFLNEAKTMAEFIGNPNIVRVHSYFEENGTGYFVMEYVDGQSFQDYLKARFGRVSWEEAWQILLPVMDALSIVHEKGIIHRDIAPDNICIARDGTVKLLDFGAARYSLGNVSQSLDVVLRHGFAPKEQYKRHGRQGPYTDIYALGATLYYAITGNRPDDAIERLDEDTLPLPSTLGANVTEAQENVILKAMAIQPEDRYQSVADFKAAILDPPSVQKPVPPAQEPVPPKQEPVIQPEEQKKPAKKKKEKPAKEKKKLPKAVIGIAAAAALAVGGFLMVESSYQSANALLEQGQYEEAAQSFEKLSFYRDSRQRQQDAVYEWAKDLLEDQKYEEALQKLEVIPGDDSRQRQQDVVYEWAEDLLEDQKYEEALQKLEGIPDDERTPELTREISYQQALLAANNQKFEKAYRALDELAGYKDSEEQKAKAALAWANGILSDVNHKESIRFNVFVKDLSSADSQRLYDQIINASYEGTTSMTVVKHLLEHIQDDVPQAKKLYSILASYTSGYKFILDNREGLEDLWDLPFVQEMVQDDKFIICWLRGKWKTSDGKYIHFYHEEGDDDSVTTCEYNLPTPKEPSEAKYFDILDMKYVWLDKNSEVLETEFQFKLLDVDRMEVYCPRNQKTYTVTRS